MSHQPAAESAEHADKQTALPDGPFARMLSTLSDEVLIARGRYSTLGKERRAQLERAQRICSTIVTEAHKAMKDCEQIPPVNPAHVVQLETCLAHLQDARVRVVELCAAMLQIKAIAWPE